MEDEQRQARTFGRQNAPLPANSPSDAHLESELLRYAHGTDLTSLSTTTYSAPSDFRQTTTYHCSNAFKRRVVSSVPTRPLIPFASRLVRPLQSWMPAVAHPAAHRSHDTSGFLVATRSWAHLRLTILTASITN